MTAEGRIAKLESALDAENAVAWELSLEQLLGLALGSTEAEVGPPRNPVKQGKQSVADLLLLVCRKIPGEGARPD